MPLERHDRVAICGSWAMALGLVVFALYGAWVSADAPYYLSVARMVAQSATMYRDVINDYTPLVPGLYSWIYRIEPAAPYWVFLMLQMGVLVATALSLVAVGRLINAEARWAWLIAACFVVAVVGSDGTYINLEVFTAFFVVSALYVVWRWDSWFLAGCMLGLSFLCKQYGVLNFAAFFVLACSRPVNPARRYRAIISLCIGGLVIFLGMIAFYAIRRVPPMELLNQISGASYTEYSLARSKSVMSVIVGAKVFLLFSVVLVMTFRRQRFNWLDLFFLTGVLVNLLPVLLQSFSHYFINTFPYLFLWLAVRWDKTMNVSSRLVAVLLGVTVLVTVLTVLRIERYKIRQDEQQALARAFATHIPVASTAFVDGSSRFLYVLNRYENPLAAQIGYDFTFNDLPSLFNTERDFPIVSARKVPANVRIDSVSYGNTKLYIYWPESKAK